MSGCGDVQDRNGLCPILEYVENCGVKGAGIKDGSLTRFKPHFLQIVVFPALLNQRGKQTLVIIPTRQGVAAAHVEPTDVWMAKEVAKVKVEGLKIHGKSIAVLVAQRVEMKSADPFQIRNS